MERRAEDVRDAQELVDGGDHRRHESWAAVAAQDGGKAREVQEDLLHQELGPLFRGVAARWTRPSPPRKRALGVVDALVVAVLRVDRPEGVDEYDATQTVVQLHLL
eukprot:2638602-Pyramimonas_sp.AAC.1